MAKKEIYISVDIEADGPIPGPHSMLSLGAVAYTDDLEQVDTFSINLEQMPDATMDENTKVEFWDKNPEAWAACRENIQDPKKAMKEFNTWLADLESRYKGKVVFVAYPAGFDWTFVYWYLIKFTGYSPFSFSSLDMKSMAMTMLKTKFRETTKRRMPKRWFEKFPHTHIALDDALEQGALFCNMMRELHDKK